MRIPIILLLAAYTTAQLVVEYDRTNFVQSPTGRHTHFSSVYTLEDFIHSLTPNGLWVQLPGNDPTACLQIVTATFSRADCSLPTYCGDVVYRELVNGWFSKVGVCIGSRKPLAKITIKDRYRTASKVIAPEWCQVMYLKEIPAMPLSAMNSDIDVYSCQQALPGLPNVYYFASAQYTATLIGFNDTLILPTLGTSSDGRYCIPYWSGNKLHPYLNGPYNMEELYSNVTWFSQLARQSDIKLPQPSIDPTQFLRYHYPSVFYELQTDFEALRCDYYLATMNTLPLGLSAVFGTITHVLETVLEWVLHRAWDLIRPVVTLLNLLHVFTPWTAAAVVYTAYTRGNLYAVLATVVTVPIIHGFILTLINN